MNKEPIDIVIPWLNPTEKWFSQYKNYCENEDPGRIRDLNTMRPAIRSILKNLPWIRYIWLIVFDEEQHSNLNWEELKNNKVKFVYHRDIIPQEFLPNFNSMIVECFAHKIEGLAENFIWSNDDMIFVKPIPQEFYFNNDKPVHRRKNLSVRKDNAENTYNEICNTTSKFIEMILGKKYFAVDYHMPMPLNKILIEFLHYRYETKIYDSCRNSKIRKPKNLAFYHIPHTIDEFYGYCEYNEMKDIKTSPVWLCNNTSFKEIEKAYKENHIVCINDGEGLDNTHADVIKNYIYEITKDL